MIVMDATIHAGFLPQNGQGGVRAFYRGTPGFEVRGGVGYGGMCWLAGV